jgi:folate-binding protein YgfZ
MTQDLQTTVPVMPDTAAISTLDDLGIIRVSGADARTFLQGQLTSDILQLEADQTQLSGYCTPKGRLLAIFRVIPDGSDLLLVLPRERLPSILKRLQLYVLRAAVQLQDISTTYDICELAGPGIETCFPAIPELDNSIIANAGLHLFRLPGDRLRLGAIGPIAALDTLRVQATTQHAIPSVPTAAWRLLDIRAGLPAIYTATSEAFVPQMTNLHQVGGVSFKKGCYTGQEVVARMHYLGKQKKQLYRLQITDDAPMQAGQSLYAPDSRGQPVGTITQHAPSPLGGCEVLAVCQTSSINQLSLTPDTTPSSDIRQLSLPYSANQP